LRLAEAVINQKLSNVDTNNLPALETLLKEQSSLRNVRIVLQDSTHQTLYDSSSGKVVQFPALEPSVENPTQPLNLPIYRDSQGTNWFYITRQLKPELTMITAEKKVRLPLRLFFRDELFLPLVLSGVIALFLAIILGFAMGDWIVKPLKNMTKSARELAQGKHLSIPVEGPSEVQELANSLNEMNRKVNSSNQAQRDFLGNISHELKTPLTSIQGFAQSIMDGTAQNKADVQQAAKVIYDEANRMNRLVLDLLMLTKLEGGTADLQKSPVEISAILKGVAEKFKPQAKTRDITIEISLPEMPRIMGDGDRLAQVFTNLVDNALKFTPSQGIIKITTSAIRDSVIITVADTGPGINPEDQKRIFERFYQVDKSRRAGGNRGIGLGLAIAQQIVLAHNGKIWVESVPEKGSTFFVQLPISIPTDQTMVAKK
jgi:signal transduction histidine kinase